MTSSAKHGMAHSPGKAAATRLDPGAVALLEATRGAPPLDTLSVDRAREGLRRALPHTGSRREEVATRELEVAGVPVRAYRARAGGGRSPVVVYFHGGGFVTGDLEIVDTTARDIAWHSEAVVLSVDYRLAPEHPFPAAVEDALEVVDALLSGRVDLDADATRVAVAGDSAGGNLAAVVAQQLRDRSGLVHQALIYPVMDLSSLDTESHRLFAEGYNLTHRNLLYYYRTYAGTSDRQHALLSPGRCTDLEGLPPATVVTAEFDPLRDEGETYAQKLAAAGVPTTSVRFNGQVHPFLYFGGLSPVALAARRFIAAELRTALR